jgi:hypothetical protein
MRSTLKPGIVAPIKAHSSGREDSVRGRMLVSSLLFGFVQELTTTVPHPQLPQRLEAGRTSDTKNDRQW